jgi:hypothetical protein
VEAPRTDQVAQLRSSATAESIERRRPPRYHENATKLRDEMGTDQETVNVQLIAVEWPAPPGVANGMSIPTATCAP